MWQAEFTVNGAHSSYTSDLCPFLSLFCSSMTWDRTTMHPNIDLIGVQTRDLRIMTVHSTLTVHWDACSNHSAISDFESFKSTTHPKLFLLLSPSSSSGQNSHRSHFFESLLWLPPATVDLLKIFELYLNRIFSWFTATAKNLIIWERLHFSLITTVFTHLQVGCHWIREAHLSWVRAEDQVTQLDAVTGNAVTERIVEVTQELGEVVQQYQQDAQRSLKQFKLNS